MLEVYAYQLYVLTSIVLKHSSVDMFELKFKQIRQYRTNTNKTTFYQRQIDVDVSYVLYNKIKTHNT